MTEPTYELDADELVRIVTESSLPDEQKLVYLYTIASGQFTNIQLRELSQSLREAVKTQKAVTVKQRVKVALLKQKITESEAKIDTLTPQAKEEFQHNLDQVVAAATSEALKTKTK